MLRRNEVLQRPCVPPGQKSSPQRVVVPRSFLDAGTETYSPRQKRKFLYYAYSPTYQIGGRRGPSRVNNYCPPVSQLHSRHLCLRRMLGGSGHPALALEK
jgi:hypothetical protein